MKKTIFSLFFLLLSLLALPAQTTPSVEPEPYDLNKIPDGILDLRRFQIIMIGSLPVVYFLSEIITSTALYAKYQTPDYIPLVGTGELTNNEKMYTVGVSFTLAFIVATVDMILYNRKKNEKEKGAQRRYRLQRSEELYGGVDDDFQPQSTDSLSKEQNSPSQEEVASP